MYHLGTHYYVIVSCWYLSHYFLFFPLPYVQHPGFLCVMLLPDNGMSKLFGWFVQMWHYDIDSGCFCAFFVLSLILTRGDARLLTKIIKPMFIQIDSRISILNKSFESIVSIKIKISFSGCVQQMKQDTNQVEFNLNMKNWEYKSNICVCLEIYFNISFIFINWKVFASSIEPYSLLVSLSKVG